MNILSLGTIMYHIRIMKVISTSKLILLYTVNSLQYFINSSVTPSLPFFPYLTLLYPSFFPLLSPSLFLVSFSFPLFLGRSCLFPFEDGFLDDGHGDPSLTPGLNSPTRCQNGERMERYSRKVFVGGLPPDIDEGKQRIVFHDSSSERSSANFRLL